MVKKSKGRGRPIPDATSIKSAAFKLEEALTNENQLVCNYSERNQWEVSMDARDGTVNILRFLRMWFDLPQNVFFSAVSYLDQFLARMKVQEKYLQCLSVSCFKVAANVHGFQVNASQLVMLSQTKCSVTDVERMSTIITQKLTPDRTTDSHNAFDLLRIYLDVFKCIAVQFKTQSLLNRMMKWQQLSARLEILMADASCALYKPSVLALSFIQCEMEEFLGREIPGKSSCSMEMFYMLAVMIELQSLCKMNGDDYGRCFDNVGAVLKAYDGHAKAKHCQKLSWRFSNSTYALTKYPHSYYTALSVIKE